jgi:hypothetical protein
MSVGCLHWPRILVFSRPQFFNNLTSYSLGVAQHYESPSIDASPLRRLWGAILKLAKSQALHFPSRYCASPTRESNIAHARRRVSGHHSESSISPFGNKSPVICSPIWRSLSPNLSIPRFSVRSTDVVETVIGSRSCLSPA